jgi:hypothetical protein
LRLCLDHLRLVRRLCVKARGRLHLFHGLSQTFFVKVIH